MRLKIIKLLVAAIFLVFNCQEAITKNSLRLADDEGISLEDALFVAIQGENLDKVSSLLDAGAYIETLNAAGNTPLVEAVRIGSLPIIKLLLAKRANINPYTSSGQGVMHVVATQVLANFLLKKGAKLKRNDYRGNTPLHTALNKEMVDFFLSKRLLLTAKNSYGRTPLHLALSGEVAQAMINAGANVKALDNARNTPLHTANSEEVVQVLLSKGLLLTAKNNDGRTPLHLVLSGEVAQAMINAGANVKALDNARNTPLHTAQSKEVAQVLLNASPTLAECKNLQGYTPQHLHMIQGNAYVAAALLENGAGVDIVDIRGSSALHYFFDNSSGAILPDTTLSQDVANRKNRYGETPLLAFLKKSSAFLTAETLQDFIQKNSLDFTIADHRGITPLHTLNLDLSIAIWTVLLSDDATKRKAQLDALDSKKRTPLHYAVINSKGFIADKGTHEYRDIVTFLKQAYGDGFKEYILQKDLNGKSAFDYALDYNIDIAESLVDVM